MYAGSIFERLTRGNSSSNYISSQEAIYQSIANNLSRILSTNAGSSETVEDYGRPDLNNADLSLKDSIELIENSLEKCVKKYEPRLYNTRIGISRSSLKMNKMDIHVEGFLLVEGKSHKVNFKADLLSNGKVKVYKDED
jgi:type VI secretion system protein